MKSKQKVPASLQHVLWSSDVRDLDLERDKAYIIHQIFGNGLPEDVKWVFHNYPRDTILKTFVDEPYKDYFRSRFYFVKDYLLGLNNIPLKENLYVKTTS